MGAGLQAGARRGHLPAAGGAPLPAAVARATAGQGAGHGRHVGEPRVRALTEDSNSHN